MLSTQASEPAGAAAPLWHQGWYRFARKLASPNFGARPQSAQTDLLVIHSISLPPGEFGNGNVQRLFTNQLDWSAHPYFEGIRDLKVSSHFFIARTGELWQFVSCDARAWHAGQSAYRGRTNCNDDSVGVELEGLEGGAFETPQYETLAGICAAVMAHYPIVYIAGHEHVAVGRKQDPGEGFDWELLKRSLAAPDKYFPEAA
jgi:AmpD protein